jgi:hypothetical protein
MIKKIIYFFSLTLFIASCRETYTPPEITIDQNILVIDGFVNVGGDSSFFKLSRSQKLGTTNVNKPETLAKISILTANNAVLAQSVEKPNGQYAVRSNMVTANQSYKVRIVTKDAKEYITDLIAAKTAPAIDSVNWSIDAEKNGIQFYASSKDVSNNTRYYKWDCEETWESRAYFESYYKYLGGLNVVVRDSVDQIYRCWKSSPITGIFIGSSAKLASDVVENEKLHFIPKGVDKLNTRYSVLVKQTTLTKEAYEYWQQLKQMTELGGSVFDVQPTQLYGNITSVANTTEPVIGYITASSVTTKRIFIDRSQVTSFVTPNVLNCEVYVVSGHPDTFNLYFNNRRYVPIAGDVNGGFLAATLSCGDCRVFGGVTTRPPFWQ